MEKREVPKSVLDETTKCPHDFRCLRTGQFGPEGKCEVESRDGKNILFLTHCDQFACPYRLSFGMGQLCTCPTHYFLASHRS